MASEYVLAIDQGTTSSRAIVFRSDGEAVGLGQREYPQITPTPDHVEHDPEAIWNSQLEAIRESIAKARIEARDLAAVGVTNQRETTILWDRQSGKPVANAIVWQSRITAPICEKLKRDGAEALVSQRTGLVLDPYFSATKIRYLLDQDPGLRRRAEDGHIAFGTVDSFLVWRLSSGKKHVTDVSNASRTMLMNLDTLQWDDELLRLFGVPKAVLPEIVSSSERICETNTSDLSMTAPICGIAGDQQAATFGQACFHPGMAKNTYGTGCFLLMNTGHTPKRSKNRLLTTVGWRIGNQTTYCLEGAVFVAGAAVGWLRDGLGIVHSSSELEPLANTVQDSAGVVFVPALTGLGAPYWDPYARGAFLGISRATTKAHVARATLEAIAHQSCDLLEAMEADAGVKLESLQVDGGAAINNMLMQMQADFAQCKVRRPKQTETTAQGAAFLAGLAAGVWNSPEAIENSWRLDREFAPQMIQTEVTASRGRWKRAVERTLRWAEPS